MLQETRATNYCDAAFGADPKALYRDPNFVPAYDASAPGPVRWVRAERECERPHGGGYVTGARGAVGATLGV